MTMTAATAGRVSRLARGVWRVADPKITLASVASMIVGAAAAAKDGPLEWGWLALTVAGIFFLEAAKNASGEIFDWDSGTDAALRDDERTPFSGGKRILVDGLTTRREAAVIALVFYALGGAAGLAITVARESAVLWLGAAGVALAYFYHAPPLRLSYRGLGEVAVALTYGPLIASGTYLVQRHRVDADVVLAGVPLGLAIAAFLLVNELPDARADALANKRTLVVRFGRRRGAHLHTATLALAFLSLLALPLAGAPLTSWLGLIGAPHAVFAARGALAHHDEPTALVGAQQSTLLSFLLLALGLGVGLVLAAG